MKTVKLLEEIGFLINGVSQSKIKQNNKKIYFSECYWELEVLIYYGICWEVNE